MIINPYVAGPPVRIPHFYGRAHYLAELADERYTCFYLLGARRMGKTSLLQVLAEASPPGTISLFISMQRAVGPKGGPKGKLDSGRLSLALLRTVKRQCRGQLDTDKVEEAKELVEQIEALAWAAEDAGLTIQLLWDEAELLADLSQATLISLRAVLQGNPRSLRTVLAASMGLAGLNDRTREWQSSPFLFGFATRYISPLDESEACALIEQRDHPNGPVTVPSEAIPALIKACDGHPYLLQALCLRLYELEGRRLRPPTQDDFARVCDEEKFGDVFQQDYDNLSCSQRTVLHLLANRKMGEDELARQMALTKERARPFLNSLAQLGLICRENGDYRLAYELLGSWLRDGPIQREARVSDKAGIEVDDQAKTGEASPVMLGQLLDRRLDDEELYALCADLGIDYDTLRGESKPAKARDLVAKLNRRNDLHRLIEWIKKNRQDIRLDDKDAS